MKSSHRLALAQNRYADGRRVLFFAHEEAMRDHCEDWPKRV
ncbi:MAG: hypothetical protein ACLQJR_35810 [Stellaceae bacterium]